MFSPSLSLCILFFIQCFVGYVKPSKIVCPPGKAQFPNPDDRYSFYKCDAGGNPITFPCPAKTWFNPCLEVCDWDTGNYNCRNNGGNGNPPNPGTNGGDSSGAGDENCPADGDYEQPEGTTPANDPNKLIPNQSCSTYGLLYQNPDDCSTYFMCNQKLVLVQCPRGYYYIPERERCEKTVPNGCKIVEKNVGESNSSYGTENEVWKYQRSLKA